MPCIRLVLSVALISNISYFRYQHIFPSLLQVYSHHQSNEMVTTAIEVGDKLLSSFNL